jgi:hypothetical protein
LKTFQGQYVQKDFSAALQTLQTHQKKLPEDVFHYNVGLVKAQLEEFALARYHFLMSGQKGFKGPELAHNHSLIAQKLDLPRWETALNGSDYLYKFALAAPWDLLTGVSLMIILVGLVWMKKNVTLMKLFILFVFLSLPLGLGIWAWSLDKAVVIQTAEISDGPSAIFGTRGEVPVGVQIVTSGEGAWKRISYPSRFTGWVKSQSLRYLE